MGKLTFRRVVTTLKRTYFIATLPICGGVLFLLGSFCFVPHASRLTINSGALMFLVGSICYWVAPFLDFWELTHNYENLLEPPPDAGLVLTAKDSHRMAALYEHLYKAHLLRIQCANCLIYMLGGGFFVGGSTLFFPSMKHLIYHGGWLYITGCVLTLAGACLAMFTASELRKTAVPMRFVKPPPLLMLPFWTDEGATIISCSLYVVGNVLYIIGSVCFFPKIYHHFGEPIEWTGAVLFVIGSMLFTKGAVIDIIVLARGSLLVRPDFAPQMRGLTMPHPRRRRAADGGEVGEQRRYAQMCDGPVASSHAPELELAEASCTPPLCKSGESSGSSDSTHSTACRQPHEPLATEVGRPRSAHIPLQATGGVTGSKAARIHPGACKSTTSASCDARAETAPLDGCVHIRVREEAGDAEAHRETSAASRGDGEQLCSTRT